jgi:hypothetical protein
MGPREKIEDFLRRWRSRYEGNRALWVVVLVVLVALLLVRRIRVLRVLVIGGVVILGCIAVAYMAALFADLPTAVVCERGRTEVEADPHILGGRFEERRVGPCVFYNPESARTVGGDPNGSVD